MTTIRESECIKGVKFVQLKALVDVRGRFMETFRKEWFPERSWEIFQTNRSDSHAGVLRGLHYHFHQVDYWYVPKGRILVGLADLRYKSPTFGASQTIEIGEANQAGVFIPCGVAHGFLALTDATHTYLVDQYYNSNDEFGVAWNDPTLGLAWGITEPIMSDRDHHLPFLNEIDVSELPQ